MQKSTIAPSSEELRPMKSMTSSTFPVYHDLVQRLVAASSHPDDTVAHTLATCASYSYADVDVVAMIMARMGLRDNQCQMIEQTVDAMFICSTAFLVQSADGRVVILCYRGTQPLNFISWLTDINVDPQTIKLTIGDTPGQYAVHAGFYRNFRATRHLVISALERALNGRSVRDDGGSVPNPVEALYIAGHSLGGAMAAHAAVTLTTEKSYQPIAEKLRAVYTFGQPMIGNPEFAGACANHPFLHQRVLRYVYQHDVVAHLPPELTGPFAHFGREYQYHHDLTGGTWQQNDKTRSQVSDVLELAQAPLAFLARQAPILRAIPLRFSADDHNPQRYLAALTPPGVTSEFGDQ